MIGFVFSLFYLTHVWILRRKIFSNPLLMLGTSWFFSQFFFGVISFLCALLFAPFVSPTLLTAAAFSCFLCITVVSIALLRQKGETQWFVRLSAADAWLCLVVVSVSGFLFLPQLQDTGGVLTRNFVFWDFEAIAPVIQSFVYGDNFPPQNERFAGVPMTYHYLSMIVMAGYSVLGLGLVDAINVFSMFSFAALLLVVSGGVDEFFRVRIRGAWAALFLTLTTGSLSVIYLWLRREKMFGSSWVGFLRYYRSNPYQLGLPPENCCNYNGNMSNLFYFIAERQLIFGSLLFLTLLLICVKRHELRRWESCMLGVIVGVSYLWHLYLTIVLLGVLGICALRDRKTVNSWLTFGIASLLFFVHCLYFQSVVHSQDFVPIVANYPKFNPGFTGVGGGSWTLRYFVATYLFAYGFKLLLFPWSILRAFRRHAECTLLLVVSIAFLFLLTNTVQLSPSDIYENHKWFRPMNLLIDCICAVGLVELFSSLNLSRRCCLAVLLLAGSLSGTVENIAFFVTRHKVNYGAYPSPAIERIRAGSSPRAVFLTQHAAFINLSGRKVYNLIRSRRQAMPMIYSKFVNTARRERIIREMLASTVPEQFCRALNREKIDFIEAALLSRYARLWLSAPMLPRIHAEITPGEQVEFVNAGQFCRSAGVHGSR